MRPSQLYVQIFESRLAHNRDSTVYVLTHFLSTVATRYFRKIELFIIFQKTEPFFKSTFSGNCLCFRNMIWTDNSAQSYELNTVFRVWVLFVTFTVPGLTVLVAKVWCLRLYRVYQGQWRDSTSRDLRSRGQLPTERKSAPFSNSTDEYEWVNPILSKILLRENINENTFPIRLLLYSSQIMFLGYLGSFKVRSG